MCASVCSGRAFQTCHPTTPLIHLVEEGESIARAVIRSQHCDLPICTFAEEEDAYIQTRRKGTNTSHIQVVPWTSVVEGLR